MVVVIGYLLALILAGLGVLGIILALAIDEVSKWKFVISFILSLLLLGLGVYYYYVVGLYKSEKEKGLKVRVETEEVASPEASE